MQRAAPLLGRAQGEPGLGLAAARRAGRLGQPLALGGVGLLVGGGLRGGQPLLEVGQAGEVLVAGGLGVDDGRVQALGLGARPAGLRAELTELLGDGRQRRVGLVQPRERDVDALLRVEPLALDPGDVEAEALALGRGLGQLRRGLVDRRLDLQQAGLRGRAARRGVRAEHVALAGHRRHVGQLGHQGARAGQVVDDGDLVQQSHQRAAQVVGAVDGVHGVRRVAREAGPLVVRGGRAAEDEPGAAEVVGLQVVDRVDGGVGTGHGDRVGGGAEGGGDGGLVPGAHRQQGRHRPHQAGDLLGRGEQRAGAVAAAEAHLEGLLAGGQRRTLAVGALHLVAGLLQPGRGVVEQAGGHLVLGVQALLARVQAGDLGLQGREVALRALGADDGLLPGVAQPADLVVGGGGAGPQGVDLAVQARQPLAAVGGRADQARHATLLLAGGLLGRTPRGHRLLQRRAVGLDLGADDLLLLEHLGGLGLQRLRVAPGLRRLGLGRRGVAEPLGGERLGAAEPLAQPRQREPGVLGARQGRQVLAQRRLEGRLALTRGGDAAPRPPSAARRGSSRRPSPARGPCAPPSGRRPSAARGRRARRPARSRPGGPPRPGGRAA